MMHMPNFSKNEVILRAAMKAALRRHRSNVAAARLGLHFRSHHRGLAPTAKPYSRCAADACANLLMSERYFVSDSAHFHLAPKLAANAPSW
jgi:hypothetical protein